MRNWPIGTANEENLYHQPRLLTKWKNNYQIFIVLQEAFTILRIAWQNWSTTPAKGDVHLINTGFHLP